MRYQPLKWLIGLVVCWVAASAVAADSATNTFRQNVNLPYEIQADSAFFDQQTGQGKYVGQVELKRGTELVKADSMELELNANRQLSKVLAEGSPVFFTDGVETEGRAQKMTYDINQKKVLLVGDAYVKQGGREFSGAEITYFFEDERVQAKGGDGTRVKLVLPPSDVGDDKP